jgi:cyclopropane-fatty-acyl-phospholipid synthase
VDNLARERYAIDGDEFDPLDVPDDSQSHRRIVLTRLAPAALRSRASEPSAPIVRIFGWMSIRKRLEYLMLDRALERGLLPDPLLRAGSRFGAAARQRHEERGGLAGQSERYDAFVASMREGPIAELPAKANEQHYELPAEFFELFLGPRLKYSSSYWPSGVTDLAAAEEAMLELVCARAGIEDGMRVLDLGCGWGSLSLWIAERYPQTRVLAVSNSTPQRLWIEAERDRRGLSAPEVITADVNELALAEQFDRVVSIEMFEHMRNWELLLSRIADWLAPDGRLFVHVFSHRRLAYTFEGTWAAERFFTAGRMPSHDLILRFQRDLAVRENWALDGTHYARTLGAWRERLDANTADALEILAGAAGARHARGSLAAWRLFLISTEQMWRWRGGSEWMVSHHLLAPR